MSGFQQAMGGTCLKVGSRRSEDSCCSPVPPLVLVRYLWLSGPNCGLRLPPLLVRRQGNCFEGLLPMEFCTENHCCRIRATCSSKKDGQWGEYRRRTILKAFSGKAVTGPAPPVAAMQLLPHLYSLSLHPVPGGSGRNRGCSMSHCLKGWPSATDG